MLKRLSIAVLSFLVFFTSSAYAQQTNKKYHVTVSQVEYDKAILVAPLKVLSGEYDIRFNSSNLEGTYLMKFDTDYFQFDRNKSRLFVNPSRLKIIEVDQGVWNEVISIGFDGKDNPIDLGFNWQTIYVIESYPNGEVHNVWYRKVYDDNYKAMWELITRRRVK